MQRKAIQLVPRPISGDTIRALEDLLADARAGRVIGLAYVAMHKTYSYTVDAAGECNRCPTLTRGMVAELDDALAKLLAR